MLVGAGACLNVDGWLEVPGTSQLHAQQQMVCLPVGSWPYFPRVKWVHNVNVLLFLHQITVTVKTF